MTKKLSFKILFLLFSASVIILAISIFSPAFSDFFSDRIASWVRLALAATFSPFPFSLGETFIMLAAVFGIVFIAAFFTFIVSFFTKRRANLFIKMSKSLIVAVMIIFILFIFTLGTCYHRSSVFELMELDRESISSDTIGQTLEFLIEKANLEAKRINLSYFYNKPSISGLNFKEMTQKVNYAADRLADKYTFLQDYGFPAKPIALSFSMTYTHLSGVYTFFTGESNVNINYPEYITVYTIAHEYAHQRGIASENEANFIAFLICMESDMPYIRYAGLANMVYSLSANYYKTDPEACIRIMAKLDKGIIKEYELYSQFFKKYYNSPAAQISDKVNDSYLKLNGTSSGTASYSYITQLITSYYVKYYK